MRNQPFPPLPLSPRSEPFKMHGMGLGLTTGLALLVGACTHSAGQDLSGTFKGTDGSNEVPSQVQLKLAVTGDGLISGIWTSSGDVTDAQLSGKISGKGGILTLYVKSGKCTGEFAGEFATSGDALKGTLKGNPLCPDRVYTFDVNKSH